MKSCASMNYRVTIIWGIESSSLISSAYIELLSLILYLFMIPVTEPLLSDMMVPFCPLMYGCTAYEAPIQHLITVSLSALNISGRIIVCRTYHRMRFNLPHSSSSGLSTILLSKETAVYIFFRALGHENNIWATAWWNAVACFSSNLFWLFSYLIV